MAKLHRYSVRLLWVASLLAAWCLADGAQAEPRRIPDAAREWTHRDGRVKQLRFVERSGELVVFQDVAGKQVYRVRFDALSDLDQAHIEAMAEDGSRIWTKQDGRSRRLRLVKTDGETALFDIPNAGLGLARVSDFIETDQRLLAIAAHEFKRSSGEELAFVAATRADDAAAPEKTEGKKDPAADTNVAAAAPLNAAGVLAALNEALKNPLFLGDFAAIGSGGKLDASANDAGFIAKVTFEKLAIEKDAAQGKLDELLTKMMPEIIEKLQIKTADVGAFKLKLVLAEKSGDNNRPSDGQNPNDGNDGADNQDSNAATCDCCECASECRPCRLFRIFGFLRHLRIRRCCWE